MLTYIPGHMSYARQRAKRTEFAEGMRNAQICVFDSSMEKKAIRKYAQAFLSGCVVAADRTLDHFSSLDDIETKARSTFAFDSAHRARGGFQRLYDRAEAPSFYIRDQHYYISGVAGSFRAAEEGTRRIYVC